MTKKKIGRPCIGDRPMTPAERKRKSRLQQKLNKGIIPVTTTIQIHQPSEIHGELIDTRQWTWEKWTLYFLGIELDQFQTSTLKQLSERLRVVINIPRRHGKTTIILRIFVLRKMCEMILHKQDINIIYVSSSKDNIVDFSLVIANDLINNERIIENYGLILDVGSQKEMKSLQYKKLRRTTIKQTQFVLDIINRKDVFNHTLQVNTIKAAIRGKGAHYVLIDDPVDVFATNTPDTKRKLTKKIMNYIKTKIYPIAIRSIAIVGTRYDLTGYDIFTQLAAELKGKVWRHISHKAIQVFGEYEIADLTEDQELSPEHIIIDNEDEWELLSRKIWDLRAVESEYNCNGLQLMVYYYHTTEEHWFKQEWQNEPIELGSLINWSDFQRYSSPQPVGRLGKWVIFVDLSTGQKDESRYTSIALMGKPPKIDRFYLHDLLTVKMSSIKKINSIVKFVAEWEKTLHQKIPVYIEVVRDQGRDVFQIIKEKYSHIRLKEHNPRGRGDKIWRIEHGLCLALPEKKIFLSDNCRSTKDLKDECAAFPNIHPEALDAVDQAYHLLDKKSTAKPQYL